MSREWTEAQTAVDVPNPRSGVVTRGERITAVYGVLRDSDGSVGEFQIRGRVYDLRQVAAKIVDELALLD